jgi:hypothetical protein
MLSSLLLGRLETPVVDALILPSTLSSNVDALPCSLSIPPLISSIDEPMLEKVSSSSTIDQSIDPDSRVNGCHNNAFPFIHPASSIGHREACITGQGNWTNGSSL